MKIDEAKHLLATNMKTARKQLKISQEVLANKVGIHRTYIGGIEQEKRNTSLQNFYIIKTQIIFKKTNFWGSPQSTTLGIRPLDRTPV
ncbi:MAG: helix-turn-helix transcriptional regulator [bacterium]|nr:helix-turn-helix transcriptional regulator [bacterium]